MCGLKAEIQHINRGRLVFTVHGPAHPALVTIHFLIHTITIAHHTKTKFHVTALRLVWLHMVHKHAGILRIPERMPAISLDLVTPRAGDLFFLLVKQFQIFSKHLLFVRQRQYVC